MGLKKKIAARSKKKKASKKKASRVAGASRRKSPQAQRSGTASSTRLQKKPGPVKKISPGLIKKAQAASWLNRWLEKAFSLYQKNAGPGDHFAAAAALTQEIPGCVLTNLYTVDTTEVPQTKFKKMPALFLLGLSQGEALVFQDEPNKYSFSQTEAVRFAWEEARLFEQFFTTERPFLLYGYQEEKISPLVLGKEIAVFYQPLWNGQELLGAVAIALKPVSASGTEILQSLQLIGSIFSRLLLEQQIESYYRLIQKNQEETQNHITAFEQKYQEQAELHNSLFMDVQNRHDSKERKLIESEALRQEIQKELEVTQKELNAKDQSSQEIQKELEAIQKELNAKDQSSQEIQKELEAIQKELNAKDQRAQALEMKLTQQKESLHQKIKNSEQNLQDQLTLSTELRREKQSLQGDLDTRYQNLRDAFHQKKDELRQLNNQNLALEQHLSQSQKSFDKKETEYRQKAKELHHKIFSLTKLQESQANELLEKGKRLRFELSTSERMRKEEQESYKKTQQSQERELKGRNQREYTLQQQVKGLEASLKHEINRSQGLQEKQTQLKYELTDLRQKKQRQLDQFDQEKLADKQRFQKAYLAQKDELKEELSHLAEYKQRLEESEKEKQRVDQENIALVEQRAFFLQQLEEEEQKLKTKFQELKASENGIADLKENQLNLKNAIRSQSEELQTAYQQQGLLRKEITAYQERQIHLEKTLFSIGEEVRSQKLQISQELRKSKELEQKLDQREVSLAAMQRSMNEASSKQKKWELERAQYIQKEKFNANSRPFSELIQAITRSTAFEEKIRYICMDLLKNKKLRRALVYSLKGEHILELKGGYWNGQWHFPIKKQSCLLNESAFGQVFATLRPQVLQTKDGFDDVDLPMPLQEAVLSKAETQKVPQRSKEVSSILLLPFVESNRLNGLLSLASDTAEAFEEATVQLLTNLSPLLAVALQQEKNAARVEKTMAHSESLRRVNHYLQERYLHITDHLHKIMQNLHRELPGSIKTGLIKKLSLPSGLLPPLMELAEEEHLSFIKWAEILGTQAHSSTGLHFHQKINMEATRKLKEHLGSSFYNIYWLTSEAVINVIHHSRATQMFIALEKDKGEFKLAIVDNGDGIVRTSGTERAVQGRGLRAIHSLAAACGGQVKLAKDEKGHGLAVLAHWRNTNP